VVDDIGRAFEQLLEKYFRRSQHLDCRKSSSQECQQIGDFSSTFFSEAIPASIIVGPT
jgi:hypothetical protein